MKHSPFDRPIPGQSLTDEPGSVPWEQPPKFSEPQEALSYHIEKLSDDAVMDNVLGMVDAGVPIDIMVGTMLTSAVMDGIHSVDVKLLIGPLLFSHVKALAMAAQIEFKESMADYDDKDEIARIKRARRLASKIEMKRSMMSAKGMDAGDELQQDVAEAMLEQEEAPQEEMPTGGLMSKEQM